MKKRQGSTLVFVVAVFSVVFIISMSITTLTLQNIRQTVHLKQRMETYYLMLSGIEIGQYAVLDADDVPAHEKVLRDYRDPAYAGETQTIWFCEGTPEIIEPTDHADHETCKHVIIELSVTDSKGDPLPAGATEEDVYINIFSQAEWQPQGGMLTRQAGSLRMWASNPARMVRAIADFI